RPSTPAPRGLSGDRPKREIGQRIDKGHQISLISGRERQVANKCLFEVLRLLWRGPARHSEAALVRSAVGTYTQRVARHVEMHDIREGLKLSVVPIGTHEARSRRIRHIT